MGIAHSRHAEQYLPLHGLVKSSWWTPDSVSAALVLPTGCARGPAAATIMFKWTDVIKHEPPGPFIVKFSLQTHTQSLMTSVHRVFLHAKVAKAEQPTHTTHRVSRHSLRRICNGLAASYRASHTLVTGFFTEPKDHTRSAPPRPIAGDVYAMHSELMASHHSHITSPASSTSSGRRFLHHKHHRDEPVSVPPPPFTVTSVTPSVIFITCRAQR
jgi:hypothetical protein